MLLPQALLATDPPPREPVPSAQREALVAKAKERMRRDTKKYSREQLQDAEQLYQVANKNWRTVEAKVSLEKMVQKYPDINRTGCAVLYLAQYSKGEAREKLLKDAVEKYSDCYYLDGCQVGGFARYLLGMQYRESGRDDKAKEIFDQIRNQYANAIDHKGVPIVSMLPKD
jgi:hypothetical protein